MLASPSQDPCSLPWTQSRNRGRGTSRDVPLGPGAGPRN